MAILLGTSGNTQFVQTRDRIGRYAPGGGSGGVALADVKSGKTKGQWESPRGDSTVLKHKDGNTQIVFQSESVRAGRGATGAARATGASYSVIMHKKGQDKPEVLWSKSGATREAASKAKKTVDEQAGKALGVQAPPFYKGSSFTPKWD